jgi:hypothetical protein
VQWLSRVRSRHQILCATRYVLAPHKLGRWSEGELESNLAERDSLYILCETLVIRGERVEEGLLCKAKTFGGGWGG